MSGWQLCMLGAVLLTTCLTLLLLLHRHLLPTALLPCPMRALLLLLRCPMHVLTTVLPCLLLLLLSPRPELPTAPALQVMCTPLRRDSLRWCLDRALTTPLLMVVHLYV